MRPLRYHRAVFSARPAVVSLRVAGSTCTFFVLRDGVDEEGQGVLLSPYIRRSSGLYCTANTARMKRPGHCLGRGSRPSRKTATKLREGTGERTRLPFSRNRRGTGPPRLLRRQRLWKEDCADNSCLCCYLQLTPFAFDPFQRPALPVGSSGIWAFPIGTTARLKKPPRRKRRRRCAKRQEEGWMRLFQLR